MSGSYTRVGRTGVGGIVARVDRLQQRHRVLGFSYAVMRKYADDGGGREAALITYYGFLSIFPVLLLAVAIVSRMLAENPDLRRRLVVAVAPPSLHSSVEGAATAMPTSRIAFVAGIVGLLLSGTGVVFSAYRTLNHLAAVPFRVRAGIVSRCLRALVVLVIVLAGMVCVAGFTVAVTALPGLGQGPRIIAPLGSCLVVFIVLLLAARLLLDRPAPVRSLWAAAVLGAAAVTLMLNLGAALLPELVRRAGPIYGSFATVAGMFGLLYLLSQALVYCAEIGAVHHGGLWPRAIDRTRPTGADARALALLAHEQERIPGQRIQPGLLREPGPAGESCPPRTEPDRRHGGSTSPVLRAGGQPCTTDDQSSRQDRRGWQ